MVLCLSPKTSLCTVCPGDRDEYALLQGCSVANGPPPSQLAATGDSTTTTGTTTTTTTTHTHCSLRATESECLQLTVARVCCSKGPREKGPNKASTKCTSVYQFPGNCISLCALWLLSS